MTDPDSFKKVQFWIDELMSNEPSCEIYIVGTKCILKTTNTQILTHSSHNKHR